MTPARFDCHVHSRYSPDGFDQLSAYAARIDAGAADGIGFAEHYDFLPSGDAFEFLDVAAYRADVASWREKGYRFFAGVEVDFVESEIAAIRNCLARNRFDFVIGSVHSLPSGGVSDRNIVHWQEPGCFERMLKEYAVEFLASLEVPEFDVIGHPGVFQRYLTEAFLAEPALDVDGRTLGAGRRRLELVRELETAMAEAAAKSGKLVEVNTSGLFAPRKQTCATPFFLEQYRGHGGRRLTLSSDAHSAANLRRGIPEARPLLESLGFHEVWLPWDHSNPVPLAAYAESSPGGRS